MFLLYCKWLFTLKSYLVSFQYYRSHAEALFTEAQTLVSMAETILADSTASYREASQLLQDSTGILHGVTSGSLPIDTSIMGHEKLLGKE